MQLEKVQAEYEKILKRNYGDKKRLVNSLSKEVIKYKKVENQEHPQVVYRLKLYTGVLKLALE